MLAHSLVQQATNWKRMSLKAIDTDQSPKTTTLYLVITAEMRGDQDLYMFSIDKCYATLQQANERVELLGQCNVSLRSVETKFVYTDHDTRCMTATLGRVTSKVRFVSQVQKVEMSGSVIDNTHGGTSPGGWNDPEAEIGAFFAETHLDLSGHVWVVAFHQPSVSAVNSTPLARRHSHGRTLSMSLRPKESATSSLATLKKLSAVEEDGADPERRSTETGWRIDSVHADSDKAIARAKKAWNQVFRDKGRCKKIREHYGFARYAFKPALIDRRAGDYETCVQIRVERVRVVPISDKPEYFLAPRPDKGRVFVPPLRNVDGRLISTTAGYRTSFLDSIERIANRSLKYEELPLALKIRHQHMERWSGLTDQKYGPVDKIDVDGDMYHALLHARDLTVPTFKRESGRPPSKAFLNARARMAAAMKDDADDENMEAKDELAVPARVLRRKPQRSQLKTPQSILLSAQFLPPPRTDSVTGHEHLPLSEMTTGNTKIGEEAAVARATAAFDGLWL